MSTETETFQISPEAAEAYEARFVPAIFAEWAPRTLEAAHVGPGSRLLDVACGTGMVTLPAARAVGSKGRVLATDISL
jgi:ubiquinone/menaquinone biosynthesis C-methylase UbiE